MTAYGFLQLTWKGQSFIKENGMSEKDLDIAIEKCEQIMEFDTRTLNNPESEDGWIFDKVYDLLQFLRQFQFETGGMDDTISRTAVLDAVDGVDWYHQNKNGEMVHGANDDEHQAWYKADDIYKAIESVPSAQPEPRWIPCSERLPEEDGLYLVTSREKATAEEFGFDLDDVKVRKMRFNEDGWRIPKHIPEWINGVVHTTVLAWMPLPEPYKEDDHETD